MSNHLKKFNEENNSKIIEHPEQAFSIDGIDDMNKNLIELNGGKKHHPIQKVRTFEPKGNKFNVGENGNKMHKYVEAAKGTNLYFAIYKNEAGKRNYVTVPLNVVIERQKQGLPSVPEKNDDGYLLFTYLSPNDLVYVPTLEEIENKCMANLTNLNQVQTTRIYKFVSCTGNEGHFVPHSYAKEIVKNEMGTNNKSQNSLDGIQIKMHCIKLNVDRLGNVRTSK
jgi:CRISPR-associated endonuclease Csn1